MTEHAPHPYPAADSFDGGDLDCGNGLLLLIRQHIDPLEPGQLLEIVSYEPSVEGDLPAWCRLTGNAFVNMAKDGSRRSFLVSKGPFVEPGGPERPTEDTAAPVAPHGKKTRRKPQMAVTQPVVEPVVPAPEDLPVPAPAPAIPALSVLPVGSWPRPGWLLRSLHAHLEGRVSDDEFARDAEDAVRLAVAAQLRAGADVVSDGEQRRDNYSSFVGGLLDNCQLIPITDLLPYVDDPLEFERELRALDVPASEVRHPAVFGPLGRRRPLVQDETDFVRTLTDAPVKVSLPGPYLLTRTMWMECISDRAYADREDLARDVVRVLREEIHHLLASGVALVQIDEPVLTEVLYGAVGEGGRTFMCGALGEKQDTPDELAFAQRLLEELTAGLPADRLALHICRGNWTTDESAALSGDYGPLVPLLRSLNVGTLVLELATPRAGELEALAGIRADQRIAVGVVNQKDENAPDLEAVLSRARAATSVFGPDRVLLTTDCGFATFADNPITAADRAEEILRILAEARDRLREEQPPAGNPAASAPDALEAFR